MTWKIQKYGGKDRNSNKLEKQNFLYFTDDNVRSLLMVVIGTYITRNNSEFKNNKMERKKIYDR